MGKHVEWKSNSLEHKRKMRNARKRRMRLRSRAVREREQQVAQNRLEFAMQLVTARSFDDLGCSGCGCSAGEEEVRRRCRRFLRYSCPPASTTYERGSLLTSFTVAGDHVPLSSFFRRTWSPVWSGGRDFAVLSYCCFAFCYWQQIYLTLSPLYNGCKIFGLVGRSVLVRRPISSCAGDIPISSIGVFRRSKKARFGSFLSSLAFFRMFLMVWTVRSASPLGCGYLGNEVVCLNSYSLAKLANSALLNCGPLSLMTSSGMPCLAKLGFRCLIVAALVVVDSFVTSKNFE